MTSGEEAGGGDRASFLEMVEQGDVDGVRDALAADASLASCGTGGGPSPILAALYRNHTEIAAMLRRHATLTVAEAAALGELKALRTLLEADATGVRSFTSDGWTPLHLAAFFGRSGVAEALIAAGALLGDGADSRNYMANRPLHAALAGAGDEETVLCLLDAGAGVDDSAATGVTPLHLAASRGNRRLVDILLARGASASVRTDSGQTPGDIARERGFPEVAQVLEERATS